MRRHLRQDVPALTSAAALTASPSPASLRAFVRRTTRLVPVPDVPGIRLHLADDVTRTWSQAGQVLRDTDPALPYWAFAWAGGLAIARYLLDHPDEVAGRRVLDVATGSGLCALVAARFGAASVEAVDVDPLAGAAVALNTRANDVRVAFHRADASRIDPTAYDLILAGDICYQETMAGRLLAWLREAADRGVRVLIGDPGRTYLPTGLERLAEYSVRTSQEIEPADARTAWVFGLSARAS